MNCGAIPDSLSESLFFGHVGGSFTGAARDRTGYFIAAEGGTLFLDEIGESLCAARRSYCACWKISRSPRLAQPKRNPCDVRIVAATNRDLTRAIERASSAAISMLAWLQSDCS